MDTPSRIVTVAAQLLRCALAACRQTPSVAEVSAACEPGNATVTSIEFWAPFTSTGPEKAFNVPSNVTIYPVKVSYRFPNLPGSDPHQSVDRNVYTNLFGELVCD
jgi:hypothetical protein